MPQKNPFDRFNLFRGILLLILGFVAGISWNSLALQKIAFEETSRPRLVTPRGDLAADEQATIELFQQASPSVVYITSLTVQRSFFNLNILEIPQGNGSGFVWDQQGHIVTNFHVIQNADAAQVTLADQSTWEARLIGVAPEKDLAVLRIEAPKEKLRPIPLGTSHELKVGQKAFAIGNPFGLDQTLTTGIVSALGREIESVAGIQIPDVIQTDAAINPGNSGGPLLDSGGRLIGVNTAIYSPSGASAGVGFAIPVDTVNWVVPDLIAYGKLIRPTLGVQTASPQLTQRLGIEGALILNVLPGSGAEQAGLRPTRRDAFGRVKLGDIIVAIDDYPVRSSNDLILLLEKRKAGEKVRVTVLRDDQKYQVEIILQSA